MTLSPYTFTDDDREQFQYWLGRIPSGGHEEALFNALSLKFRHDVAGLHMVTRGLIDLSDRGDERTRALLVLAESQAAQLTTLAAEFQVATAALTQAVVRLDQGMSVVESLEQQDVSVIHAAIGVADEQDSRSIRQHLRDLDAGMRQMMTAYAVLAVVLIIFIVSLYAFGPPTPVFGAMP